MEIEIKSLVKFLITATTVSTISLTGLIWLDAHGWSIAKKQPLVSSFYDYDRLVPKFGEDFVISENNDLQEQVSLNNELSGYFPRFYNRPSLIEPTRYSLANRIPVIEDLGLAQLNWRGGTFQRRLYQNDLPYTGWYSDPQRGLLYFKEGYFQTKNSNDLLKMITQRLTRQCQVPIYLEGESQFVEYKKDSLSYSIVYKSPDNRIYSGPLGLYSSRFLGTTKEYIDMPIEVVEEVTTDSGTWLHLNIGYEELGWVRKDETYTNYVLTYYSERAMLDAIYETMFAYADYVSGPVGMSFVNAESLSQISYNNKIFFPASTQKIYVLGKIYDLYRQGELSPDSIVYMSDVNRVPGAGVIQADPTGTPYTVDYLVDLIPKYSDNTAANLLIEVAGDGELITPYIHSYGLMDTYVDGRYYHTDTNRRFQTSPGDAAMYFALLARRELNGEPWDSQLILKLKNNIGDFLGRMIPWTIPFWNKTGLGPTEQNDVAAFETEYGTYTIAMYTEYPYNYDAIPDQLAAVSRAVYDTYVNHRSLLWQSVLDPQAYFEEKRLEQANRDIQLEEN